MDRIWIALNTEQVSAIMETYSWFGESEVELEVSYEKVDQSVGDYDRAYSLEVEYAAAIFRPSNGREIHKVLIYSGVEAWNPIFSLTDEQLKLLSI